jgi:hypothetical protein
MIEFIGILYKWQTLVGSILGGIFALLVALIVGRSVRRREEISSGMLIISDLAAVKIAYETLTALATKQNIPEDQYPIWLAERLSYSFPKLSPLFEASIVRMMPINTYLAAHLTLFHKIYVDVGVMVDRLSEDLKLHKQNKPTRSKEQLKADANLIHKHFPLAIQHSGCAEHLITDLILSKVPTWHRIRQAFWLKSDEKDCIKYLKKGNS